VFGSSIRTLIEGEKKMARVKLTAAVAKIKVESYSGHTRFMKKYFYRFDLGMDPLICDICGCTSHNGRPIIMDMDHIDGNPYNGKLTNIRFICPNCHSQTDTFKNRTKTIEQIYEEKLTLVMLGAMEHGRCSEYKHSTGTDSENFFGER
tara:strand:+ start:28 stop:474 length:447 start_codon:yes stop_codon:yes gene_type:complete